MFCILRMMRLISQQKQRELAKNIFKHKNEKCLNKYLQSGIVLDDSIKKAQNKIDNILFIENNKKDYLDPYWDIHNEINKLVNIVADLNGCTLH